MANYVSNRVVCSKSFYEEYLLDYQPDGEAKPLQEGIVTFRKLFDKATVDDCKDICGLSQAPFGYSAPVKHISKDEVIATFDTRWLYPIAAIIKAIKLDHTAVWYAAEENWVYISKFSWHDNRVMEETLDLSRHQRSLNRWYRRFVEHDGGLMDKIDFNDSVLWYYDYEKCKDWQVWETDDLLERYADDYPLEAYEAHRKK